MTSIKNLKSLSHEELLEQLAGAASVRAVFGSCLFFYPLRLEVLRRTPASEAALVDEFIFSVGIAALRAVSSELHDKKRAVLSNMK